MPQDQENQIQTLWNQLRGATGNEQTQLFVKYCTRLIELKEEGTLTEEEAAYKMVGAIQFDNLADSPVCDAIFSIAGTVELPRTTSYAQSIGKWDERTADQIKQKEWRELVQVVESVKSRVKAS
jgi:hypothetical protein